MGGGSDYLIEYAFNLDSTISSTKQSAWSLIAHLPTKGKKKNGGAEKSHFSYTKKTVTEGSSVDLHRKECGNASVTTTPR